jgi:hypothetical protein
MHVEVIKFIWLVEREVIHFMLGDIAIQFSISIGSGAGGYYFCFSLLHIVVQQHLLSCLGSTLVVWWN